MPENINHLEIREANDKVWFIFIMNIIIPVEETLYHFSTKEPQIALVVTQIPLVTSATSQLQTLSLLTPLVSIGYYWALSFFWQFTSFS